MIKEISVQRPDLICKDDIFVVNRQRTKETVKETQDGTWPTILQLYKEKPGYFEVAEVC